MTTYYDVPADLLIASLSEKLKSYDKVSAPEWASQVKTGTHRERPPVQEAVSYTHLTLPTKA